MDGASNYYLRSLESDANYVTGLRNLGHVYIGQDKFYAAALLFERLIHLDKTDLGAHLGYVSCLRGLGRFDAARDELLQVAKAQPDDPRVCRELGMLYLNDLGDELRGRKYLTQSLRLNPNQQDLEMLLNDPRSAGSPRIPGLPDLPGVSNPPPSIPGVPPK
jgi:tetratricopeptide (TPR) repeat protein